MAADCRRAWVFRALLSWEDILPAPVGGRAWVLAFQCVRQIHRAKAEFLISCVQVPRCTQLGLEWCDQKLRQDSDAILLALAVANRELVIGEVKVFEAH